MTRPTGPQAMAFSPPAIGPCFLAPPTVSEHYAESVDGSGTQSTWSPHSSLVLFGPEPTPLPRVTDDRAIRLFAIPRTAHQVRLQRWRSSTTRRRSSSHHSQGYFEEGSSASPAYSESPRSAPADCYGRVPGIVPTEDITAWNEGSYTLNISHPSDTRMPPQTTRSDWRPGPASSAGNSASHPCSNDGCSRTFETKVALHHHERYHGPRNHSCSLCDKAFFFAKDLHRHELTHTQERHLFCTTTECQYHVKGFHRKDHLQRHIRNKHGSAERAQ